MEGAFDFDMEHESDVHVKESMMDEPNPGSSPDSDSDVDSDAAEELRLQSLGKELSENSVNYEAHVEYIQCLRKLGHIEKLRQARESMSALFPLGPKMWQEWAKDEASLRSKSESCAEIENLYERGLHDYLSVPLWHDYLSFVMEHDPSVSIHMSDGLSKIRELFERALTAVGLHITEGSRIWEAYREFEEDILDGIHVNDTEEKSKQVNRIRSLFQRQLAVPLTDLSKTLLEYKLWEVKQGTIKEINTNELDGVPSNIIASYKKAKQMYDVHVPYENQISNRSALYTEKFQHFMTYLKFEETSGDPARVQVLYERAITEFPVSNDLWLQYTKYLDKTLKVPNLLKSVHSRAIRNCSWIGELWIRYLLSLERISSSDEEISSVFERALQCTFSSNEEYLDLFLTRIDGLRRRIFLDNSTNNIEYDEIQTTFRRAAEFLSPHLKSTDGFVRLHAYWARLELKYGKNVNAVCEIWESLIKTCGSMLDTWQGYISMEIEMGHINDARSIYKRCYSKRFLGTGSEDVCHLWLRFEREFGTLDDYDYAVKKVTSRLEELYLLRSRESQSATLPSYQKDHPPMKDAIQKRKLGTTLTDKQPLSKQRKERDSQPAKVVAKETQQGQVDMDNVDYNDMPEASLAPEIVQQETKKEKSIRDHSDSSKEMKPTFYADQCTAFISNLDLMTREEDLRKFFDDIGGVSAIRLLKDKFTGKSRGLAYVDFCDDEHLSAAIGKNKQKLLGQKLRIAKSDPKQNQRKTASGGGDLAKAHGRNAVHGISHTSMEGSKDLDDSNKISLFPNHGKQGHFSGKNTFAMPRAVARPLGWSKNPKPKDETEDQQPKSNDEFRKLLLKK